MNSELFDKVKNVLLELKLESQNCNKSDSAIKTLMKKYDMLFVGEEINTILSIELAHSLRTKFNIPIQHDELSKFIPTLCNQLGMTFTELYPVEDLSKGIFDPDQVAYHIVLF